jgi:hypothetical protein
MTVGTLRSKSVLTALMLLAAASLPAAAAPGAASLGPEMPAAEPAGGYVGRLALSPTHGAAGSTVTVSADGLPSSQEFELVWGTMRGSWKTGNGEYHGRDYKPAFYRIAGLRSDAAGHAAASFVAPEDFGFVHDVLLQQGGRLFTKAAYSIDMSVEISPKSGPVGTPITVDIKGIGWRQLENSWDLMYDNSFTGWVSAVTTAGTAHFTIPASGGVGTHVLRLIHGEFTFPYLNPQQNPVPDRPRFSLNFAVTPGDPVLPPAPETQRQARVRALPKPGVLVADPAFVGVDEPVTVRGSGFTPGQSYALSWSTMTGNRVAGGGFEEVAKPVAEAKADGSGALAFSFKVPDDLGGAHTVSVADGGAKKAGSVWVSTKALPLDVTSGPAGTIFRIHLKGVGWTETANIYHVTYDNNYSGYACGFNSQGDLELFMPATGEPGWHFVDLYPGIYKGEEVRPNNFRIPQLTYADDHPGEDLPAFHFAFQVTNPKQASLP